MSSQLEAQRCTSGVAFRMSPGCRCSTKSFLHFLSAALLAPVFSATLCETIRSKFDDNPTFRALGWLKRWRIWQLFKIVLISSIPHIHLGFKGVAACLTILPVSSMSLVVVVGTERISSVVSVAAIMRVGKQKVLVLVITDPVLATVGFDQLHGLAAQPAIRLVHRVCRFAFRHLPIPFPSNVPAELWAKGPSAPADCSRARISARGNDFNPLSSAGTFPKRAAIRERCFSAGARFLRSAAKALLDDLFIPQGHSKQCEAQGLQVGTHANHAPSTQ